MKIVVLVKQVPDTWEERVLDLETGWVDRDASESVIDEIGERALEVALAHKDADKSTEVVALSMGPSETTKALRKALSMGADSAIHVMDDALAGSDMGWTALVLATALRNANADLILAGNESTDGRGGMIPAMIAEHLGLPHLTFMDNVEIADDSVSGTRATETGALVVRAPLPAVVSVTERTEEARFPSFKGIMSAKKKPLEVFRLADLGLDPAESLAGVGRSVVVSTTKRPPREAGRKVHDEGNAGVELAEFLAAGRHL